MLRSRSSFASAVALFALVFSGVSLADQILETYSASLTTYLPTGKTKVQNVRPRAEQRGVNLDGSLRSAPGIPAALAGNPFESVWAGTQAIDNVRLDTGTFNPLEVDMSLPSPGFKWPVIGRTFNSRQDDSGQFDSNGYQGRNWFQISQPELQFYDDADNAKDVLYLVYGADRYVEFQRKASGSNYFKGMNGAAGFFEYASGSPDIWTYTGPTGTTIKFFGGNTAANKADWQLWKIADADGNTAYVGDSTTASTAVTNGFDSGGRITLAVDSADRGYTYTYSTHDSVTRLDSVVAQTKTGGTWGGTGGSAPTGLVTIATVEYLYYGTGASYGGVGALRMVTITTPLTDSGIEDIRKKHYRYWSGTYNSSSNPGYDYALKHIVDFEGCRAQDWSGDQTFDDDFLTLTDDPLTTPNILPYAAAYFEYDSSRRVRGAWFQGQCGCGGGADGTYAFQYDPRTDAYTQTTGYDGFWLRRTVVARPDTTYLTQYFDEIGQGLSQVITNTNPAGSPTQTWVTAVTRDSMGCVTQIGYPDNVTAYAHNDGSDTCGDITQEASTGLVRKYLRVGSTDMKGFLSARQFRAGTTGDFTYEESFVWESKTKTFGSYTLTRPLVDKQREFPTAQTTETGYNETNTDYYVWSGEDLAIERVETTQPAATTAQNGPNSGVTTYQHFKASGERDYERTGTDIIKHRRYSKGLVTVSVDDANTSTDISGDTAPTSFSTIVSNPLSINTSQTYDAQGRLTSRTLPAGELGLDRAEAVLHEARRPPPRDLGVPALRFGQRQVLWPDQLHGHEPRGQGRGSGGDRRGH
jgi:YD repeat-containing protein